MLKILIKKHFMEQYAGWFYDHKNNKARSKAATAGMILMALLLGLGVFGGLMTMLSLALCEPLVAVGLGWLYFTVIGGLALFLGIVGGAFSAYTNLYKSKDNDNLLSLPIPYRDIVASRILSIYINTGIFSLLGILPGLIVYWIKTGPGVARMFWGLIFALSISFLALTLGCLLGYLVAKISTKLKNKSLITVLSSLVILGIYYVFYFRLQGVFRNMSEDPQAFARLESVPGLKPFGQAGEGSWVPGLILFAIACTLLLLTLWMLIRSFRQIISAANAVARVKKAAKVQEQKSNSQALLAREWNHLIASPGYILNSAMGSVFLLLLGGAALIKGGDLLNLLREAVPGDLMVVLAAASIGFLAGSNSLSAPSVSLEGKSLWLIHSLPVSGRDVLMAKLKLHLLVTGIPTLFVSLVFVFLLKPEPVGLILILVFPQLMVLLFASFGLMIGTLRPNLSWTNEMVPVKQSLPPVLSMFGGMFYGLVLGGAYFLVWKQIGALLYLGLAALLTLLLSLLILKWIAGRGARRFESL
ncbi:MAG: hypothetical protein J6H18_06065 [Lachnospiraceae bacterium]|nr:hypothetical protein [Lachnospiraceae bacterium]